MKTFFMDAWHSLNSETIGSRAYWDIALQNRAAYMHMVPFIKEYASGDILDYGAGQLAWREDLRSRGQSYFSLDVGDTHPDLDLAHAAGAPYPLPDASYDTVFCCSVLEHATDPASLLTDIHRLLRDEGTVILSVPFIYYLHGAPFDYWRFTRYGVEALVHSAGFDILQTEILGNGLYHILNLPSIAFSCLLWKLGMKRFIKPATSFWYAIYRALSGKRCGDTWASIYTVVLCKSQSPR